MGNDDAKRAILRRRARFVALALASAGVAGAGAQACGGDTSKDDSNQEADAEPQPCLSQPLEDGSVPQPCLGRPYPEDTGVDGENQTDASDAGIEDASADVGSDADAEPQPCLTPRPP